MRIPAVNSETNQISFPKYVSVVMMLSSDTDFEYLQKFLEEVEFTNYTFVITGNLEFYLANASRLEILQTYGELIPSFWYLQTLSMNEREIYINSTMDYWYSYLGVYPKGVMMFQPDTFSLNYLKEKFDVEYSYGYCPDQYTVDWMSMRGGSPMPYYADDLNALVPDKTNSDGVVVLPWLLWDWIDGYTISHRLQDHPVDDVLRFNELNWTRQETNNYVDALIDRTLIGSSPFGYVSYSFEWDWIVYSDAVENAATILKNVLSYYDYNVTRVGDFVDWFKINYPKMPTYNIKFVAPYSSRSVEWFINSDIRVVRVDGSDVYSYVKYVDQLEDKYLTQVASINFGREWSIDNSVDNSLEFSVDCLGGGTLRAPIIGSPVSFQGELLDFPDYYISFSQMHNEIPIHIFPVMDYGYILQPKEGFQSQSSASAAEPTADNATDAQYTFLEHGILPPVISVVLPENKNYSSSNVTLAFTLNKQVMWVGYSLDGKENVTVRYTLDEIENVTLAKSTTIIELSDGSHSLTVYANDTAGNIGKSDTIYFTINTQPSDSPTQQPTSETNQSAKPTIVPIVDGVNTLPYLLGIIAVVIIAVIIAGLAVYFYFRKHRKKKIGYQTDPY